MTTKELLERYMKGERQFGGADLYGANLYGADLYGADLYGANLYGANLGGADLDGANLGGANLDGANLGGANLRRANLYGANLGGANLGGANLYGANLGGANLRRANLRRANLYGANLGGANLPPFQLPPEMNSFTAFKKLSNNLVCELLISADSPRTSSLVGRKCRCAYALVAAIYDKDGNAVQEGAGLHDGTPYVVGETVVADSYDDDIRVECTNGIHFFMTLQEAKDYQ